MLYSVVLIIHVILAVALIGMILIQKAEGGALGSLGGGDNMSFLSGRSTGNFLTKTTAILAIMFICTSLSLAFIAKDSHVSTAMVTEKAVVVEEEAKKEPTDEEKGLLKAPPVPPKSAAPSAPISKE